ncbi:MAG: tetratricopeptide repeat protein [Candidatus Riflebacteria bacterium]|nr:tetratricopeptide repeat protein [Candidatus Riflebacteria bacterium]
MENYYQLLGAADFASIEEIQTAYLRRQKELFSDKSPLENIPKLKAMRDALEVLVDPEKREKYDAALAEFLRGLEDRYNQAVDVFIEKRYDEAIEILKDCIRQNPQDPAFYETLGTSYQMMNKFDEAIRVFQQGLQLNTNKPYFHWYLGDLYRKLMDIDKAETHYLDAAEGFKEILKVDPKNVDALEMLADTFSKMEWFEEAAEVYEKLLSQFPFKAQYYREYGVVLYEIEALDEAEEKLLEALDNAPDESLTLFYLGLVYFKKRLLSLAIETLETSLKENYDQPEVHKLIAKIREIQKDIGHTVEETIHNDCPDIVVEGTVKWYNPENGLGVLSCSDYPEVLLHFSAIPPEFQDTLKKGDLVQFGVVNDAVGPIALQVLPLSDSTPSETLPGKIVRFDSAMKIGMIEVEPGREVFFHFNALSTELKENLSMGTEVLFEITINRGLEDKPIEQAKNIRLRKATKLIPPPPPQLPISPVKG